MKDRMLELNGILNGLLNEDTDKVYDFARGMQKNIGKITGYINQYNPHSDGPKMVKALKKKGIKKIKSHPMNIAFVIDDSNSNIKKWEKKIRATMSSEFGEDYKYYLKIWEVS